MRDRKGSGTIRLAAGIMVLMMLVIVLFSFLYIAAEADHDCCGEDCPICACIRQCENTLRGISGSPARFCVAVPAILLLSAVFVITAAYRDTPVSEKVRLNN